MKTNSHINLALMGLTLFIFLAFYSPAQLNWVKYEDNPVMEGIAEAWNLRLFEPVVIHDEGVFKMWYTGSDGLNNYTIRQIGYAESTDGINWNIEDYPDPVIPAGEPGSWDEERYPGTVLRINDTLKMWWWGAGDSLEVYGMRIFYAWSVEENAWNINPDPILEPGESGEWDDWAVLYPQVYFDGSMYHMYYSGIGGEPGVDIGYATSTNGIDWVRGFFGFPVMYHTAGTFFDQWITSYGLVFYNDTLRMFFNGMHSDWAHFRVGYAWSTDYVTWTIENNSEPVVDIGEPGEWDDELVRMPTVLVHNDSLKMWYSGKMAGNPSLNIGYALGDSVDIGTGLLDKYGLYNSVLCVSPSPFTNQATLSYELHQKSNVRLDVYNLNGLLVSTLVNEVWEQGKHEVFFNGEYLQKGVYFCVLKTSKGVQTKKIIKL